MAPGRSGPQQAPEVPEASEAPDEVPGAPELGPPEDSEGHSPPIIGSQEESLRGEAGLRKLLGLVAVCASTLVVLVIRGAYSAVTDVDVERAFAVLTLSYAGFLGGNAVEHVAGALGKRLRRLIPV